MLVLRLEFVAFLAQIEIFAFGAMIAHFALLPARVAIVGELVGGGRVQFVEKSHGGELGSA